MKGAPWSEEELRAALKLYCVTTFGRIHRNNPEIIELAEALDRTPSSVALKMTNFASLDPTIARTGMANHSKLDKAVWDDFFVNMDAYLTTDDRKPQALHDAEADFRYQSRPGLDLERTSKTRVNQGFFRSMILASYDSRCAITGIEAPQLLVASHIVPWSINPGERTNPANGICLNALHDRAFDCGLITIDEDLSVRFSPRIPKTARAKLLDLSGDGKMRLPSRFIPSKESLAYHRSEVFVAS